ncbi:endonuclease domain-containing protein [Microbacterium trichothecenolyticum]|uniref:endonuclease domain-containing protein n=1 Tax=Microbacterium trichothecenolyticum TaxID=69370 RepID=UPI0035BE6E75
MWDTHRTRADLFADGLSGRQITAAVRAGELIRARRDRYLPPETPDEVVRAVRVGGRLTCLSLLRLHEIFVLTNSRLHVQLPPRMSRMRSPHDRSRRLNLAKLHGTRLHWLAPREDDGAATCASVVVALAHAVLCQAPRAAIASIDSAVNKGLVRTEDIATIFHLLPAKYEVMRPLIDGRAQSGPETLVRLMLLGLGCVVDLQVEFDGVGFVDIVADGWLVVECDSKQHHADWDQQVKDYTRDLQLAQRGFAVLRLTAKDIMERPEEVLAALRGLVFAGGRPSSHARGTGAKRRSSRSRSRS